MLYDFYDMPPQRQKEAIDAFLLPSIAFQITVAKKHPVKIAGLYLAAQVNILLSPFCIFDYLIHCQAGEELFDFKPARLTLGCQLRILRSLQNGQSSQLH